MGESRERTKEAIRESERWGKKKTSGLDVRRLVSSSHGGRGEVIFRSPRISLLLLTGKRTAAGASAWDAIDPYCRRSVEWKRSPRSNGVGRRCRC